MAVTPCSQGYALRESEKTHNPSHVLAQEGVGPAPSAAARLRAFTASCNYGGGWRQASPPNGTRKERARAPSNYKAWTPTSACRCITASSAGAARLLTCSKQTRGRAARVAGKRSPSTAPGVRACVIGDEVAAAIVKCGAADLAQRALPQHVQFYHAACKTYNLL